MTPTSQQFITKINIKGSGIKPEPLNITLFRRIAIFGSATVCGVICGRMLMIADRVRQAEIWCSEEIARRDPCIKPIYIP